jgi:hypothetical protein
MVLVSGEQDSAVNNIVEKSNKLDLAVVEVKEITV